MRGCGDSLRKVRKRTGTLRGALLGLDYAAYGPTVPSRVVVAVDIRRAVEVQVVGVRAAIRGRRPIVAVP